MGDRCSRKEKRIRKGLCKRLGFLLLCLAMLQPLLCVDASAAWFPTIEQMLNGITGKNKETGDNAGSSPENNDGWQRLDFGDYGEPQSVPELLPLPDTDTASFNKQGKEMRNAYLLQVVSGAAVTNQVLYFEVRYKATDGYDYSQIIFPGYEAQNEGIALAKQSLGDVSMDKSNSFLGELGYSRNVSRNINGFLPSECSQSYFFYPEHELQTVTGVNLFATYKPNNGNNTWNCQDISLYRVDKLYDLSYMGNFSDEVCFAFSGRLLASLDSGFQEKGEFQGYANGCTFNWSSDRQFRLGKDIIPGSGELELRLCDEPYDSTAAEYLVQLDISDEYMRGLENLATPYGINGSQKGCGSADYPLQEQLTLDVVYNTQEGVRREIHVPVVLSSLNYYDQTISGGILDKSFVGYMQQGERVVFPLSLPELAPRHGVDDGSNGIESIKLSFGKELAEGHARVSSSRNAPSKDTEFGIQGFRIYERNNGTKCTAKVENGFVRTEITGEPIYIFTTDAPSGYTINYNM